MQLISLAEARNRFGWISGGVWANEAQFCQIVEIPPYITGGWINTVTGHQVGHIYCNKIMVAPLLQALLNISERGLLSQLQTFDGCLSVRYIRGLPIISTHSYGLALDINAHLNPLGGPCRNSDELGACFTDAGFIWGKNFKRIDGMHFQYAEW